jgi:hypothetical protein
MVFYEAKIKKNSGTPADIGFHIKLHMMVNSLSPIFLMPGNVKKLNFIIRRDV